MSDSKKGRPLVADRRYPTKSGKTAASAKKPKSGGSGKGGRTTTARKSTARRKPQRKRNVIVAAFLGMAYWIWRVLWGFTWRMGAITVLIILGLSAYVAATLPPVDDMLDGRARGSVTMLDRDGKVFAWRGDQFGGVVTAQSVSPNLKNAIVATEDKRFYSHFGVSPRGIASAIAINLREGRGPLQGHGGSTITQQTAKLLCLGVPYDPAVWKTEADYEADCRRTTLWRKAKEAVFAVGMEMKYSKDEILAIYMNRAYLGEGTRGFEAASQRYFGKSAANVNPAEAAMLAGLLVAPTRYAPTNNLERSRNRANIIIGLMEEQDYISTAEADAARANPAGLSQAAQEQAGGYFADWVMASGPEFLTRKTTEDVIIATTLDQRIQKAAEDAMKSVFEEKLKDGSKVQAAIVVMSSDGAVRGMVGGRKTKVSGAFNRATQALRQTGSSFKPFVYAAALDLGHSPLATVEDTPLTINIPGSGPWSPDNYDHKFRGTVTLTDALRNSLNIPAVRVAEAVGLDNVRRIASDFGIDSDLAQGPALALGVSESTLIEMVGAYAGILNGGSSVTPYGLTTLTLQGETEPLMEVDTGIGERVITEPAARELTWMMKQVVDGGTGHRARIDGLEVAGKTGTTQAARDAWFVGFSADYVAGVWMGYDDNTPLTGVTGAGLPAEIWRETMLRVHDGLERHPLPVLEPTPAQPMPGTQAPTAARQNDNPIERALKNLFGLY
ncbi:transglycosylase domain-containing protein [Pseudooceanicola sp. LIPI14-2-Ac024]|uniref:transglycosylase domain-containing protein n=1 Tax=Pseudooceanicola sp. LIPI14-2-Ac024 TaxID=3344875 RepID=UPI0035D00E17